MTKDARARQGRRLWLARLTPPIITTNRGDAEALPIIYWTNQLTGAPRCKYTVIFTLNPFMFYVGVDTHLPVHRCNDDDETMLCVYGLTMLSVEGPPTIPLSVEGPPTIPLSVEGPPTIPPSVEGPPTIPPIVEGPLLMLPSVEDTAMIKSGFKGKRANKKFGRYGKRGGNKKLNYTLLDHSTDDNSEHGFLQQICPTTTGRKVIKKQIILRLSIVTSSCQEAQQ